MDADIYALIEVENNSAAPDSIVNALNTALGDEIYALATESPFTGSYAIKNVFIYKIATVTPLDTMITSTDVLFYPPPIARQFEVNTTGGKFNLIANHYRYKGCDGATGADTDQMDGQGCYNATRREQSIAMLAFLDQLEMLTGNDKHLVVGDFNAYSEEDPMDVYVGAGYEMLIENAYSYAYMSEFGSLDHALASPSLVPMVMGAKVWNINSDEPPVLDYNLENIVDDLYQNNPYRSSDHDPVIIGLTVEGSSVQVAHMEVITSVFPNPFNEMLVFQTSRTVDLEISDAMGRTIMTIPAINGRYELDAENISNGVWFVSAYVNGVKMTTQRVVKH